VHFYGLVHTAFNFLPFFSCACFKMLFNVPVAKSSPGLPAMVAYPGLVECLY